MATEEGVMGAGRFVKEAEKQGGMQGPHSLNRGWDYNRAKGLKKGLRRGRRRNDKKIVERETDT